MHFIASIAAAPLKILFWVAVAVLLVTGSLSNAASVTNTAATIGGRALGITAGSVGTGVKGFQDGMHAAAPQTPSKPSGSKAEKPAKTAKPAQPSSFNLPAVLPAQ